MRVLIDVEEVIVPQGGYGEPDDMLCQGCGHEGIWGQNHNVKTCLQYIREDHEKAIADLQKQIDSLSYSGKE
jgi:hypothetical protein